MERPILVCRCHIILFYTHFGFFLFLFSSSFFLCSGMGGGMGLGGFFFSKVELGLYYLLAGVDEFLRHKWFFLFLRLTNVLYVLMYYLKKKIGRPHNMYMPCRFGSNQIFPS